ncbi:MAG TPA: hypothetical protein VGC93_06830 [Thermoanaerobaculia bacterium]
MADYEDWLARWIAEDGVRVLELLRKIVAVSGVTRKELDQRLGWRAGYASAVLTRRIELKQEHAAAMLLGLGVHPGLFYDILYPKDRPIGPVAATADVARRLALAGFSLEDAPPEPAPSATPMTPAEIKALVDDAVQRALAAASSKRQRTKPPRKR